MKSSLMMGCWWLLACGLCFSNSFASTETEIEHLVVENATGQRQELLDKYDEIAAVAFVERCQQILDQLQITVFSHCGLLRSPSVNAYSFADNHLYLASGLIKRFNNDHQLAHVIAHEAAHLQLKHHRQEYELLRRPSFFFPKRKLKKFYQKIELEADQWANKKLQKHGFDASQIHFFWQAILREKHLLNKQNSYLHLRLDRQQLKNKLLVSTDYPAWLSSVLEKPTGH